MVNLLMKFYDINSGDIKIDGISTKELTRENIHDLFIMVLQDTWLFNGTIRDNLSYGKLDATDEEIVGEYRRRIDSRISDKYVLEISNYGTTRVVANKYFGE